MMSLLKSMVFFFPLALLVTIGTLFSESLSTAQQCVTASDYCEFLNEVAATDNIPLYNDKMSSDLETACIIREDSLGCYHYFVIAGRENAPIEFTDEDNKIKYCSWSNTHSSFGKVSSNEDAFFKSNSRDFETLKPASTFLSFDNSLDSSSNTDSLSPDEKFYLSLAVGMSCLAFASIGMLQESGPTTGAAAETTPSLLQKFRDAATSHTDNTQLIAKPEGTNIIITPVNPSNTTDWSLRSHYIFTAEKLEIALKEQVSPEKAKELITQHLPLSGEIIKKRRPLTPLILKQIFADLEEANNQSVSAISHAVASVAITAPIIPRHTYLKELKKGKSIFVSNIPLNTETTESSLNETQGDAITLWDELGQQFSIKPIIAMTDEQKIQAIQKLNNLEKTDREERRADRYSRQEQDPPTALTKLLSTLSNRYHSSVTLVENSHEVILARSPGTITHSNQPILLYGFDGKAGNKGPREKLKTILNNLFQLSGVQTMNAYNACLGIGINFNFDKYCDFIDELKKNSLQNRIKPQVLSSVNSSNKTLLTNDHVTSWANFLCTNASAFVFSHKVSPAEQAKRFIAKNYYGITQLNRLSPSLQNYFKQNNWNHIIQELQPALDLLEDAGKQLISNQPLKRDILKDGYKKLTRDQKIVLDSSLIRSFFRVTSKLGLAFARKQHIPVLFAWKLPEEWNLPTKEELYRYLEIKPYRTTSPQFRKVGTNSYPEAITSSEMRHLGRQRLENQAPNYLLTTKIEKDPTAIDSQAPSEAKEESK